MTNTIGSNSSMASMASSVFGSARQVFKAVADAASAPDAGDKQVAAEAAAKRGRRGTVLDCYA
ncbi:hypothetical protein AB0F81_16930 [Actinoplanes sp. NPDC024001]|uniref:hypothetical protein n=1 Tax=Actinoplanes sp. NPDC024001 TaxID=3154598 RepID=UPI0033C76DA9